MCVWRSEQNEDATEKGEKKKKKKQRWQVGLKFVGMALERGGSGVRENM